MQKAKIFQNGQSQAVRIPKEYRFSGKEVSIIPLGNSIVLQPVLQSWQDVFNTIKPTGDFLPECFDDLPETKRKWELFK